MRQLVLDTETTGLSPETGHRVIEIACIEMVDRRLTGGHYHVYLNPDREVDEGAFRVHGISSEFLQDKPRFSDVLEEFIQYLRGAELIIHNAPFDLGFLNAELKRAGRPKRIEEECNILDTLLMAREKHPGQRNSLDALCKRYEVENSHRKFHGALLDSELLALVYLAMTGGQTSLFLEEQKEITQTDSKQEPIKILSNQSPLRTASAEELEAHLAFIELLRKKSGKDYWLE